MRPGPPISPALSQWLRPQKWPWFKKILPLFFWSTFIFTVWVFLEKLVHLQNSSPYLHGNIRQYELIFVAIGNRILALIKLLLALTIISLCPCIRSKNFPLYVIYIGILEIPHRLFVFSFLLLNSDFCHFLSTYYVSSPGLNTVYRFLHLILTILWFRTC